MLGHRMRRVTGADFYPYKIPQSCRFNDDDSAYLEWTPTSSVSDRTKFTFYCWFKRCNLGLVNIRLFQAYNTSDNRFSLLLDSSDKLSIYNVLSGSVRTEKETSMVFRDVGSWYNVIVIWNTADATAEDRCKLYVNGTRITDWNINNLPSLNEVTNVGYSNRHSLSRYATTIGSYHFDGYMAQSILNNGVSAYTDFGQEKNGIWIPKKYTGSYGTNGFHLDFADENDLGKDVSGNNNDFTSSGLASNDKVLDSPTNNYCVVNILDTYPTPYYTTSNGNLSINVIAGISSKATFQLPATGKWYWEYVAGNTYSLIGIGSIDLTFDNYLGHDACGYSYKGSTGDKYNAAVPAAYGDTYVANDVIGIKWDADNGELEFLKNNVSQGVAWTGLTGEFTPAFGLDGQIGDFNFGQLDFAYTPPAGFKALCSNNLPTPSIKDSSTGFDAIAYEGNITVRDITDLNFPINNGGLVWLKNRDQPDEHKLIDTVRGATKELSSDSTVIESIDANGLTAFLSNGFSLGTGANGYNDSGENFVAWCFRMGAKYGFDIQTYEGTGVAHAENHNLDGVPELIIRKSLGNTYGWSTYHHHALNKIDPETDFARLNETTAWADDVQYWNDTAPTSTQFTVGIQPNVNQDGYNYITYLWRSIPQFSKVFSYIGNENVNGSFVHCGFRPRYILIKRSTSSGDWMLYDAVRDTYNPCEDYMRPNSTSGGTLVGLDILSNGFKLRTTNSNLNTSLQNYVGIAYAEQPGKWSNAR